MTKRITTSAQKTVAMTKAEAMRRLKSAVAEQESLEFTTTSNPDIFVADRGDGTKVFVASFAKNEGRSIAMIDHKHVDEADRERWQQHWRDVIDDTFGG